MSPDNYNDIIRIIRKNANRQNMGIRSMARVLDMSPSTVSRILAEKTHASMRHLMALSELTCTRFKITEDDAC